MYHTFFRRQFWGMTMTPWRRFSSHLLKPRTPYSKPNFVRYNMRLDLYGRFAKGRKYHTHCTNHCGVGWLCRPTIWPVNKLRSTSRTSFDSLLYDHTIQIFLISVSSILQNRWNKYSFSLFVWEKVGHKIVSTMVIGLELIPNAKFPA